MDRARHAQKTADEANERVAALEETVTQLTRAILRLELFLSGGGDDPSPPPQAAPAQPVWPPPPITADEARRCICGSVGVGPTGSQVWNCPVHGWMPKPGRTPLRWRP